MIQQQPEEKTLFDKANDAAKNAMQSVVDLASRTRTPVIVFRNGKIERIEPDLLQGIPAGDSGRDKKDGGARH